MGCFPLDLSGREVVAFNGSFYEANSREWIFVARRIGSTGISLLALFFNLLLVRLIATIGGELREMRTVVWLGCAVDMLMAAVFLLQSPFVLASFGRMTTMTNNGLRVGSRQANGALMALVGVFAMCSWGVIPLQFAYRFSLLRWGERPSGRRLHACCLLVGLLVVVCGHGAFNFYLGVDDRFAAEVVEILRAGGYANGWAADVHRRTVDSPEMAVYQRVFVSMMLLSASSVLFFSVAIRRRLRLAAHNSRSSQLNAQIDRVLIALAVTPLLTEVLPNVYVSYALERCEPFFLGDLFN
ncbi:hypothetical protein M3Y99_01057400 [Aphelenchoides fujianensis]|nr:hypothetical protein M3Y99_01057400 [Aphelenchoides fujianensis]